MNIFPAITFIHVLGAITLFISWALEYNYLTTRTESSVTNEEVTASRRFKNYAKLGGIAVFVTLVTGIWLMLALWGSAPWMIMALVSIFLIKIMDVLFSRKAASLKTEKVHQMFYLMFSIRLRIAIGIGIIALMIFKPVSLLSSLSIVFISFIGGAAVILSLPSFKRIQSEKFVSSHDQKSKSGDLQ
jgi:hypothetical protein